MTASTPFLEGSSDVPPPIPEHTNLQSMRWFKMDIMSLLNSDFVHKATHEELGAAFLLWTKSVHQLPAGSLPNDDVVLARMAGFDPRSKRWKKSRDMILYGWTLRSDGRLYHPTVADTVLGMLDTGTQGKPHDGEIEKERESNRRRQRRFKERQRELARVGKSGEGAALSVQAKSEVVTPVTREVTLPLTPEVTLPVTEVPLTGNGIDRDKDREGDKEKHKSVTGNADGNVTEPLPVGSAREPSAPVGAGLFADNSRHYVESVEDGKSPIPDGDASPSARFDEFWEIYPSKVGKKPAMQKWRSMKLDRVADEIIADVRARLQRDRKWQSGYLPNPSTYLNQERWKDQWEAAAVPVVGPRDTGPSGKPSPTHAFAGLSRPGQRTAMAVQQWLEKEVIQ